MSFNKEKLSMNKITKLSPNVNTIKKFVQNSQLSEHSQIYVYAINPEVKGALPRCESFTDLNKLVERVKVLNRKHNIYYSWNEPKSGLKKKAKERDMQWLQGFHVDIDRPKDVDDLDLWFQNKIEDVENFLEFQPHIIDTGNGIQALWELDAPLPATQENIDRVQDINKRLTQHFEGDAAHNVDRILRLPGTVNWPTEKKKAYGCVPIISEIVKMSEDTFIFDDFKDLPAVRTQEQKVNKKRTDYTKIAYTGGYVPMDFEQLESASENLSEAKYTEDNSRAAAQFIGRAIPAMVQWCKRDACDFTENHVKNLCELVIEADYPFMDHYDREGLGKLGYDVERILYGWGAEEVFYTPQSKREHKDLEMQERIRETVFDELSEDEHLHVIRTYFRKQFCTDDLPNCEYSANGHPKGTQSTTLDNVKALLKGIGVTLKWNAMSDLVDVDIADSMTQRHLDLSISGMSPQMGSYHAVGTVMSFATECGLKNETQLETCLIELAKRNMYHPFVEYVAQKEWDGVERISQVADCVESDNELKHTYFEVLFKSIIAATHISLDKFLRTNEGAQLDSVLVLDGNQGIGKSRFLRALTPTGFFAKGSMLRLNSPKEADYVAQCLSGVVCVLNEIGQTFRHSENEVLKDFIARTEDTYRGAWVRYAVHKPRMTVFCGTANGMMLTDQTGNRRYMMLHTKSIDIPRLREIDLQQVYAEAYHYVMVERETWWLTKKEEREQAENNEKYRAIPEEESALENYINNVDDGYKDMWVNAKKVLEIMGVRYTPFKAQHIRKLLTDRGFNYQQKKVIRGKALREVFEFPVLPEVL